MSADAKVLPLPRRGVKGFALNNPTPPNMQMQKTRFARQSAAEKHWFGEPPTAELRTSASIAEDVGCRRNLVLSNFYKSSRGLTGGKCPLSNKINLTYKKGDETMKIAIIGAGSVVFCKTLILDVLATPNMENVEFCLMAPSERKSGQVRDYIEKVIKDNGLSAKVWTTTDRREAIKDAKYIILTFQVGGNTAFGIDYNIPMKYGVDQCIGDSMGPGGVFRAARSAPVLLEICDEIKELSPDALVLNYVNPMAMVCWTLGTTGINYIGLCHGVQTTLDLIAGYVDVPKDEVDFLCAGINHMGWFLEMKHKGVDLYPKFKEVFEKPEYYVNEKVRGEVMRQFGYFCTESTGHLSEYLPWFRSSQRALDTYCDEPGFGGETGAYFKFCDAVATKYSDKLLSPNEPTALPQRSIEYGSYIIEAMELNRPFKLNGNITNNGLISNLPDDCCSEVPVYVDGTGIHPMYVGKLPTQLAALNLSNINVQRLGVEAAITGDPELLVAACALDPLASTKCTLPEIREMVAEMLEAQKEWLPQFAGKKLRATPEISIPKDITPVSAPVDPALAIFARFGELGS